MFELALKCFTLYLHCFPLLQTLYTEVSERQQPLLNQVYQANQIIQNNKADFPTEMLQDLDLLAGDVRDRMQQVKKED